MLTTGVDAKNVRNVILTAPIRSMTEFKQIIGRGTRVFEGKDFFTILDFVGATNLFYDPRWDGDAVPTDDPATPAEPKPPREPKEPTDKPEGEKKEKAEITIRGRRLRVIDIETTYVGAEGKPLRTGEYLEYLIGVLGGMYDDESRLREIWSDPRERKILMNKLENMHIDAAQLSELAAIFEAEDADIYDVLAHLSFNHDILTRSERVLNVEHRDFIERHHSTKARDFLEFILRRYERDGVAELDEEKLSSLIQLSSIDKEELKEAFGGLRDIKEGYLELQREIYR